MRIFSLPLDCYLGPDVVIPFDCDTPDVGDVVIIDELYYQIISQPRWDYDLTRYVFEIWKLDHIPVVRAEKEKSIAPSITVWPWEYAPEEYKVLSVNGGDEDWVAFIPENLGYYPHFLLDEYRFGNVMDDFDVEGGTVVISSHA